MAGELEAISGALNFWGNIMNNVWNAQNVQDTNDMNYMIARYGYEQQKEMIRQQNEYNSPAKQLERYKEAGLNPNLVYGEGKASAGMQSSIPQFHEPHMVAPQVDFGDFGIGAAIGTFLQLKQLELQNKSTEAEVEQKRMQNLLTQRYITRQDYENTYYRLLHGNGEDSPAFRNYSADIRLKEGQIDLQELEKGFRDAQIIGQKLSNQEKHFLNRNLLPLMLEAKKLEIEGMSYENIIKKVDSETERLMRITGISANPFRAAAALSTAVFGNSGFGRFLRSRWNKLSKPNPYKSYSGSR